MTERLSPAHFSNNTSKLCSETQAVVEGGKYESQTAALETLRELHLGLLEPGTHEAQQLGVGAGHAGCGQGSLSLREKAEGDFPAPSDSDTLISHWKIRVFLARDQT